MNLRNFNILKSGTFIENVTVCKIYRTDFLVMILVSESTELGGAVNEDKSGRLSKADESW